MALVKDVGLEPGNRVITFINEDVAIANGSDTELVEVHVQGAERLAFRIENAHASVSFDTFIVQYKYHPDGTYIAVADAAGDFTTPVGPVIHKTASPVTLAAAGVVPIHMDVQGVFAVKILASGNAAASTATIEGTLR